MHKIMITYPLFGEAMDILHTRADLFMSNSGQIEPFIKQLAKAEAFITRNVHPTIEQLEKCPNLKVIGIPGVGYQNYDIDYLNQRGIALVYCPGINFRSVAEHALTLALSLSKNIVRDNNEVRKGNYGIRNSFDNCEMLGKNVGIVGYGAIGKETAKLFNAIGLNVYVYDPFVEEETCKKNGYIYCFTLDELLLNADIISLHMPSTDETRHMFSYHQFETMKKGVIIINCARGAIIDEDALFEALVSGKVLAAGLDVMEKEPFDCNNKLFKLDNVLFTPHVAGVTTESSSKIHKMVVETSLKLLDGVYIDNIVNKEALKHSRWKNLKNNKVI
jgi:D-3-phosphoglycerate dehydrogenase